MVQSSLQKCQRIQAFKEMQGAEAVIKLVVERFDPSLGWYAAGGLTFPIHQLPLIQQTLAELSGSEQGLPGGEEGPARKVIPFPALVSDRAGAAEA